VRSSLVVFDRHAFAVRSSLVEFDRLVFATFSFVLVHFEERQQNSWHAAA
jgi:hypothetical protein